MEKQVLINDMKDCFKIVPTNTEETEFVIVIGSLSIRRKIQKQSSSGRKLNKTDWNLVSAFFFALKEAVEHEKKNQKNLMTK